MDGESGESEKKRSWQMQRGEWQIDWYVWSWRNESAYRPLVLIVVVVVVYFRKTAEFGSVQMLSGREFHADGPACEKARSPNLDRSCGSVK